MNTALPAWRPWIYGLDSPLSDQQDERTWLGGKGASLRQLHRLGFNVPATFTICTDACRRFLASGGQWPNELDDALRAAVAALEQQTGLRYGVPAQALLLAIRSGAAQSLPGMLATVLFCGCNVEIAEAAANASVWQEYCQFIVSLAAAEMVELPSASEADRSAQCPRTLCLDLLQEYADHTGRDFPQDPWAALRAAITAVWQSWNSPRAEAFRQANGMDMRGGTAVSLQPMARTDVAGVVFSRDPRGSGRPQVVIECVQGNGHTLVSGRVQPQRFTVPHAALRDNANVVENTVLFEPVGVAPLLTTSQVGELAQLALQLQEHLAAPQDIEWGYVSGTLTLFQTRPMAQLEQGHLQEHWQAELQRLRALKQRGARVWVRHNLQETLPAPLPLTWDIVAYMMSGRGGYGAMYRQLGFAPSAQINQHGFLELLFGRIYADPDRLSELICHRYPFRYDIQALKDAPELIESAPDRFATDSHDKWLLLRLPHVLWITLRSGRRVRRAMGAAAGRFQHQVVPQLQQYVREQRELDLNALDLPELQALLSDRCRRVLQHFAAETLRMGLLAGIALSQLQKQLNDLLGPHEGERLLRQLVGGLPPQHPVFEEVLWELAQGTLTLEQALQQVGHRGANEMELAVPRWSENPAALQQAAMRLAAGSSNVSTPCQMYDMSLSSRMEAEAVMPTLLRDAGASSLESLVQHWLRLAQQLLPYREAGRHYFLLGYRLLRDVIKQIGVLSGLGDDIFFLRLDELQREPLVPGRWRQTIDQRRAQRQALLRFQPPAVIDAEQLDGLLSPCPTNLDSAGREIAAGALSSGRAAGGVLLLAGDDRFIANNPSQASGRVLVAPSLDPSLAPLLLSAAALVVDQGGLLSHGAIVARQLGVPAVVCRDATRLLKNSEIVVVDADRGCIVRQHVEV